MSTHILLVQPDAILGETYRKALQACGTVAWARSAEQAIQLADDHAPDIVVLELKLPRHNGVEFLYEFKSYPEWRDVPVVVVSHGGSLDIAESALHDLRIVARVDSHTTSLKELCSIVQEALGAEKR